MIIYFSLWFFIFALSITFNKKKINHPLSLYLLLFIMVLIAGGRGLDVGVDTKSYNEIYGDIGKLGVLAYLEPGWNFLNRFIYELNFSFNGFLSIVSILTLVPIFYVSKKISLNPFFSILVYYSLHIYCGSFNAMRQYLALSFVFLSYYYLFQRKYLLVTISTIIAISIHKSTLLVVPVLVLINFFKIPKVKVLLTILITCYVLGLFVGDSFYSLFVMEYGSYVSKGLYRDSSFTATVFSFLVIVFSIMLVMTLDERDRQNFWCKIFIVSSLVMALTFRLQYGSRIYVFFSISEMIFFPYLIYHSKKLKKRTVSLLLYFYLFVVFMRMILLNANDIMPYDNVWLN